MFFYLLYIHIQVGCAQTAALGAFSKHVDFCISKRYEQTSITKLQEKDQAVANIYKHLLKSLYAFQILFFKTFQVQNTGVGAQRTKNQQTHCSRFLAISNFTFLHVFYRFRLPFGTPLESLGGPWAAKDEQGRPQKRKKCEKGRSKNGS